MIVFCTNNELLSQDMATLSLTMSGHLLVTSRVAKFGFFST